MDFLNKKLSGIKRRIACIKYGMFYIRNSDFKIPRSLKINGSRKELKLQDININEFVGICINDCYHLGYLKRKLKRVNSIVDVGANQGMFLIAARQYFPNAKISAYEPNELLKDILDYNANQLDSKVFYEAVMKNDCTVNLNFTDSDLATTAFQSENGNVIGSSLKKVIGRNGPIDILKLDCEGAEWELLEDVDSWKQVKSLAMEYHLWGKEGITMENLFQLLHNINFQLIEHTIYNSQQGFVLAINKNSKLFTE